MFKLPATRATFWSRKIGENKARATLVRARLLELHWRVLTLWECAIRGKHRLPTQSVVDEIASWLTSDRSEATIRSVEIR